MPRVLTLLIISASIVMGIIAIYGIVDAPNSSTSELEEDQLFIGIALLAGAVGLLAVGVGRFVSRD